MYAPFPSIGCFGKDYGALSEGALVDGVPLVIVWHSQGSSWQLFLRTDGKRWNSGARGRALLLHSSGATFPV
jgi:hypothetical protein